MSYMSRLNRDFQKAPRLELSDASRYILMSDCHRHRNQRPPAFLSKMVAKGPGRHDPIRRARGSGRTHFPGFLQ